MNKTGLNRVPLLKKLLEPAAVLFSISLIVFNLLVLIYPGATIFQSAYTAAYLLIVPGVLVVAAFRLRYESLLPYVLHTISLSILVLTTVALAVNTVLFSLLGIAGSLTVSAILAVWNPVVLILFIRAVLQSTPADFRLPVARPALPDGIVLGTALLAILLCVGGANKLNNEVASILPVLGIGACMVLILLLTLFQKQLSGYSVAAGIVALSSCVLLMVTLRSNFLYGSDNIAEFLVARTNFENMHWDPGLFNGDFYNKCLSISLFPQVFSRLTGMDLLLVFKVLYPLLFSLIPLAIYALGRYYHTQQTGIAAAILFLANSAYWGNFSTHFRAGFAMVFFCMVLMVLAEKNARWLRVNVFFLLYGFLTIVFHYSTAFVMLLWVSGYYAMLLGIQGIQKLVPANLWLTRITPLGARNFRIVLNPLIILMVWILFLFWYSGPDIRNNIFIKELANVFSRIERSYTGQDKADRSSVRDLLNVNYTSRPDSILYTSYTEVLARNPNRNPYPYEITSQYPIRYIPPRPVPLTVSSSTAQRTIYYGELFKRIGLAFMGVGILYTASIWYRKRQGAVPLLTHYSMASGLLLSSIMLPVISIAYNIGRVYVQTLAVLSVAGAAGLSALLWWHSEVRRRVLAAYLILHFAIFTGAVYAVVGGVQPSVQFHTYGEQVDQSYVRVSELAASRWLATNGNSKSRVLAEYSIRNTVAQHVDTSLLLYYPMLAPAFIPRNAYVFLGSANTRAQVAHAYFRAISIKHSGPNGFLDNHKNLVYSNRHATIYR